VKKREELVIARRFMAGEAIDGICLYDGRRSFRGDAHVLDVEVVEDILRRRLKQRQWKEGT